MLAACDIKSHNMQCCMPWHAVNVMGVHAHLEALVGSQAYIAVHICTADAAWGYASIRDEDQCLNMLSFSVQRNP